MSAEKHIETSGLVTPCSLPDSAMKLSDKTMGQDRVQGNPTFPASVPKVNDRSQSLEQHGGHYPPTSCYDYNYPGQGGTFGQADDKGYFNVAGGSYTQPPCSYGPEAFQCYSYDSTYAGNTSSDSLKSVPSGSGKPNGYNASKAANTNLSNKTSTLPYNSRVQQSSNFAKPMYQNPPLNPSNKYGSGFQTTGLMKGFHPASKYSSFTNRDSMLYGPTNYQSNGRTWNNNNYKYKTRESFGRNAQTEALQELTCGPRSENRNTSPENSKDAKDAEQPWLAVQRDAYNLQDFIIEYDDAKFFVIKSYSEDDVHKSIKYDVWSSTPNGNKKLDAAFRKAEAKAKETCQKCPVFLFFSVNGSGQFVGVAEMIGQVDFSKNMDFWQLDKWNGFFPIKWHIIKDVPNMHLKHITLENNENKAVTHSRDTQEIGLKQGLEMLSIFKNYSERASVLDDFNFYENREKTLKAKRNGKPAPPQAITNGFKSNDREANEGNIREKSAAESTDTSATLVSLTKNLSLNS